MATYYKESYEWLQIRANTGYWFSPNTLRFFGSRIYWNTLTKIPNGWLFISSEDNFDRTERLFSIRKVRITPKPEPDSRFSVYSIETLEWQTLEDLKTAKKALDTLAKQQVQLNTITPPTEKEQN